MDIDEIDDILFDDFDDIDYTDADEYNHDTIEDIVTFNSEDVVTYTVAAINKYGWVSRGMEAKGNGAISTYQIVVDILLGNSALDLKPSDNERKFAIHVLSWLRNKHQEVLKNGNGDYSDYNLSLFEISEIVNVPVGVKMSILCSGVNYYNQEYNRLMKLRKGFVGDVGQTITVKLKLLSKNRYDTQYGGTWLVIAEDVNKKYVKFFCGLDSKIAKSLTNTLPQDEFVISGIVKSLDTYKENDYTMFSHVTVGK